MNMNNLFEENLKKIINKQLSIISGKLISNLISIKTENLNKSNFCKLCEKNHYNKIYFKSTKSTHCDIVVLMR